MRRLSVVDLETGGQRPLGEGVRVVAEEGVVVAQQGVVDGAVGVSDQQVLMLVYHLLAAAVSYAGDEFKMRIFRSPHLHHHGGVGHISPPLLRPGPAHQRISLIVVHGEVTELCEACLDFLHGLDLLLEDGPGGASPLKDGNSYVLLPEPQTMNGQILSDHFDIYGTEHKDGSEKRQSGSAHLLVQGDVVDPDACLTGEVVGAVVTVLQHSPAVRRVRGGMTRVTRTTKCQQTAGSTKTL